MSTPSLRGRIRNGTLLLLVLVLILGAYTLPRVYRLGGAIRQTLYRNYVSIDVAQHVHALLVDLQLAERDGQAREVLPHVRSQFEFWMNIEDHDFTEVGEPQIAHDIEARAAKLFGEIESAVPQERHDEEFAQLHQRVDDLIKINRDAMFRADSRSASVMPSTKSLTR